MCYMVCAPCLLQAPSTDEFANMWAQLQGPTGLVFGGGAPRGPPPQPRGGSQPRPLRGSAPQQGPSLQQAARALPTAPLPSHHPLGATAEDGPVAQVPNTQRQGGTGRTRPPKQEPKHNVEEQAPSAGSVRIDVQQLFSNAKQGPAALQIGAPAPSDPAAAANTSLTEMEKMLKALQSLQTETPEELKAPQTASKGAGNQPAPAMSAPVSANLELSVLVSPNLCQYR